MDLLNPFLIYRPKVFLFEASRYPVRVYSEIKKIGTSFENIPTRNYSLYSSDDVEKFKFGITGYNIADSFDEGYNGWSPPLSDMDKKSILDNQKASFILENYLKIVSGLNVSELTFNEITQQDAKQKIDGLSFNDGNSNFQQINDILNNQTLVDFNRIELSKSVGLEKTAVKVIPNPDQYIKKLLQPKKFDRVINIIFDPEFQVDYQATQQGLANAGLKDFFTSYINSGELINDNPNYPNSYIDRDKTPEDVEFNSYFVSLESHNTYDDGIKEQS